MSRNSRVHCHSGVAAAGPARGRYGAAIQGAFTAISMALLGANASADDLPPPIEAGDWSLYVDYDHGGTTKSRGAETDELLGRGYSLVLEGCSEWVDVAEDRSTPFKRALTRLHLIFSPDDTFDVGRIATAWAMLAPGGCALTDRIARKSGAKPAFSTRAWTATTSQSPTGSFPAMGHRSACALQPMRTKIVSQVQHGWIPRSGSLRVQDGSRVSAWIGTPGAGRLDP